MSFIPHPATVHVDENAHHCDTSVLTFDESIAPPSKSPSKTPSKQISVERTIQSQQTHGSLELCWKYQEQRKLFGRDVEIKKIQDAFDHCVYSTKPEIILLTGNPGVGKSTLAKKVFADQADSTNFIVGKCDMMRRPDPYAPFVQALTEYVNMAISNGPEFVNDLRISIVGSSESEMESWKAISALVPCLGKILGENRSAGYDVCDNRSGDGHSANNSLNGSILNPGNNSSIVHSVDNTLMSYNMSICSDSSSRNGSTRRTSHSRGVVKAHFRRVFRAISSLERPLVLLVDDLQWADANSLDLLQALVLDTVNTKGFVVLATCRTEDFTSAQTGGEFFTWLQQLEKEKGTTVNKIPVTDLPLEAVEELVADVLQQSIDTCEEFSRMIFLPSNGNPLFIVQLIRALKDFSALVPHPERPEWLWDNENGREFIDKNLTMQALITHRMLRLSSRAQLVLRTCASMGSQVNHILLSYVLVDTYVSEAIDSIIQEGLVEPCRYRPGFYSFSHDCIQQTAYSLIKGSQKNASHLMTGRMLLSNMTPLDLDDNIFLVVNQMSRGMAHLQSQNEKDTLAGLCLRAGRKAATWNDHKAAVMHYMLGTTLLERRSWMTQYKVCLDLHVSLAEAAYFDSDSEMVDFAIAEVLANATSFEDKVSIYLMQVASLASSCKLREAIDVGLKILLHQGESFPSKVQGRSAAQAQTKLKKLLKGKTNTDLLHLPNMDDRAKLATMDILGMITTLSLVGYPDLFPLLCLRLIKLSLEFGLCPMSAQGLVMYGIYVCGMGDIENGYNYGKLALAIFARYTAMTSKKSKQIISGFFYGWIAHWKEPIRSTLGVTLQAHRELIDSGDTHCAMMSIHAHIVNSFLAGIPLPELEKKVESVLKRMIRYKYDWWEKATEALQKLIYKLMGKSHGGTTSDTEENTNDELEKVMVAIWKLIQAYYFKDYANATKYANQSQDIAKKVYTSSFLVCAQYFYDGMTALAVAREVSRNKNVHLMRARNALKKLNALAEQSPLNCNHYVHLLKAELNALNGSYDGALKLYNLAVITADEQGFVHDQALACERAYVTLLHCGDEKRAMNFFDRADELYVQWGATARHNLLRGDNCNF